MLLQKHFVILHLLVEFAKTENMIAMLIDADNVSYRNIKDMTDELARFGNLTIKRIYGDFTKSSMNGWKDVLLENAISPIQQYN